MRKELETIREIEEYLQGQLSPADKAAFEARLAGDAALQEAVTIQQAIMEGVERAVLQQQIAKAAKRFARWQQIRRWGWGGAGVLIVGAIVLAVLLKSGKPSQSYNGHNLPAYNEAGEPVWADADRQLAAQVFTIQAGRDTILSTTGGLVLAVPANGWLSQDGQPVTGSVSLVVKEALDAASIMRAGLSTRSGQQLLETGGMFFVDARQGSDRLKINPAAGIYVEVPTDSIKPGMQLYKGQRLPNGGIDWVNPVALEQDLTTVDIHSLGFYPPHYLDSLRRWGYDHLNKKFTDSLYYSFAAQGDGIARELTEGEEGAWRNAPDTQRRFWHPEFNCILNPATIQTIWSDAYQQTLIATREFEARLRVIHASGENELLQAYLEGLDLPMWVIDSAVAAHSTGHTKKQFEAFAARRDGKVRTSTPLLQKLKAYYKTTVEAHILAARKTQEDYWRKQDQLDSLANRTTANFYREEQRRLDSNLQQELHINLKAAYRQLGYDTVPRPLPPPNIYRVQVVATGWYNVDRAVTEATIQRQSMRFTDSSTQRTATLTYSPVQFIMLEKASYDRVYLYLLPDKLSSFMRVNDSAGVFSEQLNDLLTYRAVIVGYRGEQAWVYTQPDVKPGQYSDIRLTSVNNLDSVLLQVSSFGQATELRREQQYFRFERKEQRRRKQEEERWELWYRTWKLLLNNEKKCIIAI